MSTEARRAYETGTDVEVRTSRDVTDVNLLRRTLGTFATGVTVVTTGGPVPHGMTANSFASVSLDPPLVLVCVVRDAVMHSSLTATEFFGVSVLAADQEPVARHFANRLRPLGASQFDAVGWLPGRHTGVPMIDGALAHYECALWQAYDGGDHTIFIGRLLTADRHAGADPLLFFQGGFRRLTQDRGEAAA